MITLKLSQVAEAMNGVLHGEDLTIRSVTTDSRVQENNDLFIALKGEKFDAWDFVPAALKNGIKAAVLTKKPTVEIPWIEVSDTRIALGKLGSFVKSKIAPQTIGITGTCGKTSVKDMTYAIMSKVGNTLATKGNFNNDIGVPLTLLRLDESVKFAVVEMGTNHPGELNYSTALVGEDVCLINNIGYAHLEGFKSLHGVFDAKYEIFSGLKKGSPAIFSAESEFVDEFKQRALADGFKPLTFGFKESADARAENVNILPDGTSEFTFVTAEGRVDIKLHAVGLHNVLNACAASCAAMCLGATFQDVKEGLESYKPYEGRLKTETYGAITLIDDTYNASANAVFAAIDVLEKMPGKKILILGDMGELGDYTQDLHSQVGSKFKDSSANLLICLGDLTKYTAEAAGEKGLFFSDRQDLMSKLTNYISKNEQSTVLVKGSHGMRMGEILNFIRENLC